MNRIYTGTLLGAIAGVLDVIPMVIQKLPWSANLSAFFHWTIVGFFISTVDIGIKGITRGILIAVITLIPIAFLVWWNDPSSIIPMSISTIVYGGLLGFLIDKYGG